MNTYIYTLKDPITNEIRYVGKANDPNKRILDHIKECKSSNISHKISWIKSLLNINLQTFYLCDQWEGFVKLIKDKNIV